MPVGIKAGISPFLMAIMVGNGANAGSLSPFAPTGIIVNGTMARIGLAGYEWPTYFNNLVAHFVVAFAGYLSSEDGGCSGRRTRVTQDGHADSRRSTATTGSRWPSSRRSITAVIFFRVNVGMGAFAGAVLLPIAARGGPQGRHQRNAVGRHLLVSGVTVLIALLERFQGIELFTAMLARVSNRETVTGIVGFVTAFISVYSSTSGVVLPAFLPTIPGLDRAARRRRPDGDRLGDERRHRTSSTFLRCRQSARSAWLPFPRRERASRCSTSCSPGDCR